MNVGYYVGVSFILTSSLNGLGIITINSNALFFYSLSAFLFTFAELFEYIGEMKDDIESLNKVQKFLITLLRKNSVRIKSTLYFGAFFIMITGPYLPFSEKDFKVWNDFLVLCGLGIVIVFVGVKGTKRLDQNK